MPPRSLEHRRKISEHRKGHSVSLKTKEAVSKARVGKPSWNKGLKLTEDHRRKLSEAKRGEKSILWKGGLVALNQQIKSCYKYRLWRSDIFTRDNFSCVFCGAVKVYLNADHIKPKAAIIRENNIKSLEDALRCEELWNINNGRTLCEPCHRTTETYANPKN